MAFVPLRGGSKEIKDKNIIPLCGKPLCFYVLNALQNAESIDQIFVSTDSDLIARTVENFDFHKIKIITRSAESAADTASSELPLLEFLRNKSHGVSQNDIVFFAQATSPLLTEGDVEGALHYYKTSNLDSLLSGVKTERFFWTGDGIPLNYDPLNRPRRQDLIPTFVENGAFYVSRTSMILDSECRLSGRISVYPMAPSSMTEVDSPDDLLQITSILAND